MRGSTTPGRGARDAGAGANRAGSVAFVGHEPTDASAALLREGVTTPAIDQAPELQARRSVEIMPKRLGMFEPEPPPADIPFTLHTRENA